MNQAFLRNPSRTVRACAAETREFVVGTESQNAALALLRWENDGGSPLFCPDLEFRSRPLLGSASQIEWAESIRDRVNDEFDRVAQSFRSIAHRQDFRKRRDTEAIIAILEDKRAEVLGRDRAGYFIRDWREISDQVRQLIGQDSRYQAIKAENEAGNSLSGGR